MPSRSQHSNQLREYSQLKAYPPRRDPPVVVTANAEDWMTFSEAADHVARVARINPKSAKRAIRAALHEAKIVVDWEDDGFPRPDLHEGWSWKSVSVKENDAIYRAKKLAYFEDEDEDLVAVERIIIHRRRFPLSRRDIESKWTAGETAAGKTPVSRAEIRAFMENLTDPFLDNVPVLAAKARKNFGSNRSVSRELVKQVRSEDRFAGRRRGRGRPKKKVTRNVKPNEIKM